MTLTNNIDNAFRGSAGLTKDYYEALVSVSMQRYKTTLTRAEKRRDELNIRKAVYEDLNTKLDGVFKAAQALRQPTEDSTASSVFTNKKTTFSDASHRNFMTATANASAMNGSYSIRVDQLAAAHQTWGAKQASGFAMDLSAAGGSGTFTLQVGGDAANQIDVTIEDGASLSQIATAINERVAALIADESLGSEYGVQATVVDGRLTLTSASSGTEYAMSVVGDDQGILATLGVVDPGAGNSFINQQEAKNAILTVNGIEGITRSKNTGLDDVIEGVTLNLTKAHTEATDRVFLTVASDDSGATNAINSFVSKINDLMKWLKDKTLTKENSDGTYTRGSLSDNIGVRSLRTGLAQQTFSTWNDAPEGFTFNRMDQIGLSVDRDMNFSLDSSALSAAIAENPDNVKALMDTVMGRIEASVSPYVSGNNTLVERMKSSAEDAVKNQNEKVARLKRSNERREEMMRDQIARQFAAISSYNDQGRFLMTTMYSQFG
jgi:flagellar hook-associated protein 2